MDFKFEEPEKPVWVTLRQELYRTGAGTVIDVPILEEEWIKRLLQSTYRKLAI